LIRKTEFELESASHLLVWALAGYVVIAPSISPLPSLIPYNEKRALQVGLLLVVGVVLLVSQRSREEWLSTFWGLPFPARVGLGTVVGVGIVSSALAPAPFYAVLELGHFVLLFIAAGVVASAVRRSEGQTERVLLGGVVVSALLYAVYFFVSYGVFAALPVLEIGRDTVSGFANARFFNQYQTWTLPLLVGAVLVIPRRWRAPRGAVFGLAALWWALIFVSNVRGTVTAVGVAGLGAWLLFGRGAYRWVGIQVAAVAVGGGLYYILFHLAGGAIPEVAERFSKVGQSRRLQHWRKCLDMAWAHPWFGGGPMHYAWPPFDFAKAAHPHNAFMQWLAEWGIPATGIMSGLTVWGGWTWFQQEQNDAKTASERANGLRVALVGAILAGTAHAMVSGLLVTPVSQMLLVLVGGWAWGRYRPENGPTKGFSRSAHAVLAVLLIGSLGIVGSSFRDLSMAKERRVAFHEAADREALSPRYWQQGYLHVRDPNVIERARGRGE